MKTKKLTKQLVLNKDTISSLSPDDMLDIRGASFVNACTMTCSFVHICCDTKAQCIPPEECYNQ